MHTFVRFLACMRSDVLLEMWQLGEFSFTDFTFIWTNSCVYPIVLGEIRGICKTSLACWAAIGLWILFVYLLTVNQHVRFCCKNLKQYRRHWISCGVSWRKEIYWIFTTHVLGLTYYFHRQTQNMNQRPMCPKRCFAEF